MKMPGMIEPASYEDWYHTRRGSWIADHEFKLMMNMLKLQPDNHLLDVGCGTGYFSRHFALQCMHVTGIDPDESMLDYARQQPGDVNYIEGDAQRLPFNDNSFDYCVAVTSLCFISNPGQALGEMWRVSRKGVLLGLLNRQSILYYQKHGKGAYQGARWDTCLSVKQWLDVLNIRPKYKACRSTVFIPSGSFFAKQIESITPTRFPFGGFLAVKIEKTPT